MNNLRSPQSLWERLFVCELSCLHANEVAAVAACQGRLNVCSLSLDLSAPITNVEAIEGQQTHLYCPMTTPNADKINMVLWFKDDVGVPIYR